INGATISVRSLSPFGERVGVRGLQTYREILTPHPTPLPVEVGFIRLRPLKYRTRVNPSSVGEGADRVCRPTELLTLPRRRRLCRGCGYRSVRRSGPPPCHRAPGR